MNPGALRETEDLRKQNETLRKQAEALQSYIATRLATPGSPSGVPTDVGKNNLRSFLTSTNSAAIMARVDSSGVTRGTPSLTTNQSRILPAGGSGRARTHSIRAGDTPYSIARQYQIKVGSLLSANPGLDPKKMRVGQVLNIPAS
jgi:LysM repeat protein